MEEKGSCRIIASPGYGEVEEKNSRFLSEALFVDSEEAARGELTRVRKQYYDARHHCSAWIIGPGGENARSGDDGEPAGTAGRPILEVIRGAGVTNAMVVVTRYFGGTLLGTGGLVRAYTAAAREALEHAAIRELCLCEMLEVSADYAEYEKIRRYFAQNGLAPVQTDYTDRVSLRIPVRIRELEKTEREIISLTAGKCRLSRKGQEYYPVGGAALSQA